MGRFGRVVLPGFLVALFAFALPAFAANVTVNGTTNFSSLDGSVDDADHVVNGVFTVNGDLTVNGTINCNDDGAGANSACAMQFAVSGNVVLGPGSAVFAENRNSSGSGGDITFTVGGNFLMQGPATTFAGALISSSKINGGHPAHAGDITVSAGGTVTQEAGAVISAAANDADAGTISITGGAQMTIAGMVLAGPSRTIATSTIYTGVIMSGGGGHVVGGAITIKSLGHTEPGLVIASTAIIAGQGGEAGPINAKTVTLEACNVQVNGLVASLAREGDAPRVAVRSGTAITVDGSNLGASGIHLGMLRADATHEDASSNRVDLYAAKDIVVTGPPSSSTLFAATSNPGTTDKRTAGTITVISTGGSVTASGNAFQVSSTHNGDRGGNVNVSAKNDVTFSGTVIDASGATSDANRAGGHIAIRSYSGAVNWISGVGDVRPVGSAAGVPVAQQGSISLTACTTVSTSGTSFPTNGAVAGVFPTITTGSCSPSAPSLPAGEPALPVCCNVITVINPAVSSGPAGAPFSQTFTQTGAIGTATFTLFSGTLPSGLTLASNGVLSGTPTVTGSFPIRVMVTDSQGCTGVGPTYPLTITCPTITVTNPAVDTGVAGTPFSQTFTQSGGVGTTTFSLAGGTLPAGLTLASNGVLSGTPTQTGNFPITVKATDSNGCTGIGPTYNLTINCQTITVTNPAVSSGVAGSAFSQTFTQSGGIGTTTFSLASGTLPAGLTLSSAGVLSGTPTQTGSFPITVKATDSNGCSGTGPTYNLTIACQTITVTNPAGNSGVAGSPFSETFTQSGGIGTTTFSLASGTLPTGLTLSSGGVLSGTPTQTGTFTITVKATDANGCSGTGPTYTLTIACQTITVTNPAVSTGTAGTPFSQSFTQSGAVGTATFSIASGTLPSGLTLSASGVLSGSPTQSGSFPITVKVTDSNGCTGTGPTYTLVITCQTITVTNPANNSGTVGSPFSETFTQSGANGTATFTTSSTLPTGLNLSAAGVLSGTPTQTGTFPIVVTVTDSNGCTGTGPTYTLVINCQTITVTNPANSSGTVDSPFSATFTQSGAIGGATFTLASGSLPAGLNLSSSGVLSGTPQVPGTFTITVKVTDANGCTGTGPTYTLTIGCQTITVTNPSSNSGTYNTPLSGSFTFTQSGVGTHTPAVFTINSGSLPSGVSLSSSGVLAGTPTQTGVFSITVKVTDANGCTGIGSTYTLTIAPNATNKSYIDVGNTQLDGGLPAPATPTVIAAALSNGDSSDAPITYALVVPPIHGTLTIFNANGTFLYTPNVGNTATDSFTYTATSNGVSVTRSATITFTGMVWYVDNATVAGTNDGRSNTPFLALSDVTGVSSPGDFIYVSKGSGPTTGSYTMLSSQKLIGAGATLNVGSGVLVVAGSAANTPTLSGSLTLASNVVVSGIDMSTGTSNAITGVAVSGINVNARNVTTTTGTAVSISAGSSGTMTFTSITAGTSAGGPLNAISVANFNGSFTVAGDGSGASNGSGGTIQKTTGNAISLTSVSGTGVSLASMVIKNSAHEGIRGISVNNFALTGCQLLTNGTTLADNGVHMTDLTGAAAFTNDTVTGSFLNNVWLDASTTSTAVITSLTVTNGTYSSSANDDGFLVSLRNAAAINTATFTGVTFSGNFAKGLQLQQNDNAILGNGAGAPSTGTVTVTGCTITNNNVGASFEGGGGTGGTGSAYFRFVNNTTILGSQSTAVNFANGSDSAGGTFKAFVSGNSVGNAGVADSGSAFGDGMRFFLQGQQAATVTIVNNTIRQIPFGRGIDVEELGRPGPAHGQTRLDVKITGNDVNPQDTTGFPLYAIYVSSDAQGTGTSGSNVNAEIHGNTVPASPDACDTMCGGGTGMIVYETAVGASGTQVATLFNFSGAATVNAEIANNNTGTAGKTCTQGTVTLTNTPPNTVN